MDDGPQTVVIILICLLFSAFFSGAEIAFVSANKLKIELDRKQGLLSGRILTFFVKNTSTVISALLLGNNVALVVYGIFMAGVLEPVFRQFTDEPALILTLQTVVSTIIVLITGEFLPKAFFRINPNRKLKLAAFPLLTIYVILYLPTILTIGFSKLFLRLFGVDTSYAQKAFTRVDLDHYVRDINERVSARSELDNEIQILKNALEFSKVKARDCLVPRTEIEAVNIDEDIHFLRKRFVETGYSKIVIYRDSIDNIIGYVHAFELFHRPQSIKEILLPVFIVPEAVLVKELLPKFTKNKRSIAVVVDEFGGTSGMITIEDIIEEIFGEIKDEHDVEEQVEKKIDDKTYIFSGRTEIDYLNQNYQLHIEESAEYETLAGYVINKLEDIPEPETQFETDRHIFTVLEVSDAKIDLVRVRLKD
ncbi:MAG: HlyC/CorC family transporter [Bacteroidetes bacterium]|nr:HlyC/CorC family transporter [Bacteroidota bacterium]